MRVHPRAAPIRSGLFAIFIVSLVFFGVLGFLGLANGSWPIAVAGEALALLVILLGALLASTTYIEVDDEQIVERGFWGRLVRHPLPDVDSVVLARVYDGDVTSEVQQLIVRDRRGKRMLRMRGAFWTPEDVRAIADAIGEPVIEPSEPMTFAEFFERYPGSAYWFERRGLIIGLSIVGGVVAITGVVFGVMALLGLPLADGT